jgi:hypothetical protein
MTRLSHSGTLLPGLLRASQLAVDVALPTAASADRSDGVGDDEKGDE